MRRFGVVIYGGSGAFRFEYALGMRDRHGSGWEGFPTIRRTEGLGERYDDGGAVVPSAESLDASSEEGAQRESFLYVRCFSSMQCHMRTVGRK